MALSTLVGTTWYMNETVNGTSLFTKSTWNVNLLTDYYSDDFHENYSSITCGERSTLHESIYEILFENNLEFYEGTTLSNLSFNSPINTYRYVKITGGTDATNSTLIAWFEANGTQILPPQMLATILFSINNPPYSLVPVNIVQKKSISSGSGITDLTGTTWLFNSELEPPIGESIYNIDFTSNNVNYTFLRHSFSIGAIQYRLNSSDLPGTTVYWFSYQPAPAGATYGWQLEAYRTITITGGSDATNATLISWLQSEATFVSGDSLSPARLLPTIPPTTFISFTISGVTYEAEEGMTWYEWVNSEYNTNGYTCTNVNDYVMRSNAHITVNNNFVYGYDIILENQEYVQGSHSG